MVQDVVAVVRELRTNVVRHANASRLTVAVNVERNGVRRGHRRRRRDAPITVRSGLANLADRAERRGGRLTASSGGVGHRGQLDGAAPVTGSTRTR